MGGVLRELLPCPLPFPGVEAQSAAGVTGVARSTRSKVRRKLYEQSWCNEAVSSLNELYGRGDVVDGASPFTSAAQRQCLNRISSAIGAAGVPPGISPAEAFVELCGHRPGYDIDPSARCDFQRELVSLPDTSLRADGAAVLRGQDLDAWNNWRSVLLRDPRAAQEELEKLGITQPYTDRRLRKDKKMYALFIKDLLDRELVSLRPPAEATVGVFVVAKKNAKQRLILDTRVANVRFKNPWHAELPSAASWSRLETPAGRQLILKQTDVNNAFYRIRTPPGMWQEFLLPVVSVAELQALGCQLPGDVTGLAWASPGLEVLAMGFSWALYFCQKMVEERVLAAGFQDAQRIIDRQLAPTLEEEQCAVATYVDGVAVISTNAAAADAAIAAVKESLNQVGLECGEDGEADDEQVFVGLRIDRDSGRISVSSRRLWRLRLGVLHLLRRGRASGVQLRRVVGHFVWICLMRREALCILSSVYRFIAEAGEQETKLWGSVQKELRWMATLAPLFFADTQRGWREDLYATDASGADGASSGGGFGVCRRRVGAQAVARIGRVSDRWRFFAEDCVAARKVALEQCREQQHDATWLGSLDAQQLSMEQERGVIDRPPAFVFVDRDDIGNFESWQTVMSGAWSHAEGISRLEGKAVTLGFRHALRNTQNLNTRITILCDNMGVVLALTKGRGCAFDMNRSCREVAALSLMSGSTLCIRWIPSEHNPADKPSRMLSAAALAKPTSSYSRHAAPHGPVFEGRALEARFRACIEELAGGSDTSTDASSEHRADEREVGEASEASDSGSEHPGSYRSAASAGSAQSGSSRRSAPRRRPEQHDVLGVELDPGGHGQELQRRAADVQRLDAEQQPQSGDRQRAGLCGLRVPRAPVLPRVQPRRRGQVAGGIRLRLADHLDPGTSRPPTDAAMPSWLPEAGARKQSRAFAVPGPHGDGGHSICAEPAYVWPCSFDPVLLLPPAARAARAEAPTAGATCVTDPIGVGPAAGAGGTRRAKQDAAVRRERVGRLGASAVVCAGVAEALGHKARRRAAVALRAPGVQPDVRARGRGQRRGHLEPAPVQPTARRGQPRRAHKPAEPRQREAARPVARGGLGASLPQACKGDARRESPAGGHHHLRENHREEPRRTSRRQVRRSVATPAVASKPGQPQEGALRLGGDTREGAHRLTDQAVRARLTAVLRSKLRQSRRSQVYLELFSGSGKLAKHLRKVSGYEAIEFDVQQGEEFDLTRRAVVQVVLGWLRSRVVRGVWAGFPCTTWSTARWPPLRSRLHLLGLPACLAVERDRRQIQLGNSTLRSALTISRACVKHIVPMVLENPHSSLAWQHPQMQRIIQHNAAAEYVVDYCQFGCPWRKRTRLVGLHTGQSPALCVRCTGRHGLCSRTGQQHQQSRGTNPLTGKLWTRIAEPHPTQLASRAARTLHQAAEHIHLSHLCKLAL